MHFLLINMIYIGIDSLEKRKGSRFGYLLVNIIEARIFLFSLAGMEKIYGRLWTAVDPLKTEQEETALNYIRRNIKKIILIKKVTECWNVR